MRATPLRHPASRYHSRRSAALRELCSATLSTPLTPTGTSPWMPWSGRTGTEAWCGRNIRRPSDNTGGQRRDSRGSAETAAIFWASIIGIPTRSWPCVTASSSPSLSELLQRFVNLLRVTFGFHFAEDLLYRALLTDQESSPFDSHVRFSVHALFFPHPVIFSCLVLGVRQQHER